VPMLPKSLKARVADVIRAAIGSYAEFDGYRVARVIQNPGEPFALVALRDSMERTYYLEIAVKERL
jgi:hypothetical protein